MEIGRETGEDIWEIEREVYKRTDVNSTRFRQENKDKSRHIRLSMECEDGRWRLVAFLSKSLNETEKNYEIHDKEMLVVIRELENWRHLLEGAKYKFNIWTDYNNLEYLMKA